jgi:HD-like signal output (HDOD) protein
MNTYPSDRRDRELDLEEILAAAQLPALPQSAIRVLRISQDPELAPAEFAAPIESDMGLASQVLRFVNSSYFGFAREVNCVKQAVTLVGMRTIQNFVLWSAVFSQVPDPKCGQFRLKQLWEDSLRRALFARDLLALFGSRTADDAFAGALLQDMAIPLLAKGAPALYAPLIEARDRGKTRLSVLEHEAFGWTHAEAARSVAQHWNLPEELAVTIGSHLDLERKITADASPPVELAVAISALLPSGADAFWLECETLEDHYQQVVPTDGPSLAALLQKVDEEFGELAPLFKAGKPRRSLLESYQEATATVP